MLEHHDEITPAPVRHMAPDRAEWHAALLAALVVASALFLLGEPVCGAIDVPMRIASTVLAGLTGAVIAYVVLHGRPRSLRGYTVMIVLVLVGSGLALNMLSLGRGLRLTRAELAARPSALLVTVDVAPRGERGFPPERWVVLDDVYTASAVRDPALASVLTGRPVHFHLCRFGGDAPRRGAFTVGQMLAQRGFDARVFDDGGLPDWCADGMSRTRGGLTEAVEWIADRDGTARFAHVHLERLDAAAIDGAVAALDVNRVEVFVVSLVGTLELDDSARFLRDEDVDVLVAWRDVRTDREPLPVRPRSAATVAPALLARLDMTADDRALQQPVMPTIDGSLRQPGEVVVSVAHRRDGRPHRILVHFDGGALAIEATPLGGRSEDDWEALGPSMNHAAYRNAVRGLPPGAEREGVLARLQRWRDSSVWNDDR